jgi:4-hydroxyphenylpyruvate dioxygenase-like putative hemolysin
MAPEVFVSDGSPDSIVGQWVARRDGIGGIHHLAYQVDSVADTMKEWKEKGYAEFSSAEPMKCPGLTQVFTKPSELTGVIYEFIERGEFGFCKDNVKNLMLSTKNDK